MNYKSEQIVIELITFDSFNGFVSRLEWEKNLAASTDYMGKDFEVTHKIRQMDLRNFGITKREDVFYRSGMDTWYLCNFFSKFGLMESAYINGTILKDLPYTVWIRKSEKDEFGKWCGKVFCTEADAQAWADAQMNPCEEKQDNYIECDYS